MKNIPEPIAVQSWTLRQQVSKPLISKTLSELKQYGFQSIEVSYTADSTVSEFIAEMNLHGLKCVGIHLPCLWNVEPTDSDLSESIAEVNEALVENSLAETDCPLIFSFMGHPDMRRDMLENSEQIAHYKTVASKMKKASSFLEFENPAVAYHLYDYDLTAPHGCIQAIVDAGISLVLDNYYLKLSGVDVRHFMNEWKEHVISAHLNDYSREGKQVSLGVGIGRPQHFVDVLAQEAKNLRTLVVEHDPCDDSDGLEMLKFSSEYLRRNQLENVISRQLNAQE